MGLAAVWAQLIHSFHEHFMDTIMDMVHDNVSPLGKSLAVFSLYIVLSLYGLMALASLASVTGSFAHSFAAEATYYKPVTTDSRPHCGVTCPLPPGG